MKLTKEEIKRGDTEYGWKNENPFITFYHNGTKIICFQSAEKLIRKELEKADKHKLTRTTKKYHQAWKRLEKLPERWAKERQAMMFRVGYGEATLWDYVALKQNHETLCRLRGIELELPHVYGYQSKFAHYWNLLDHWCGGWINWQYWEETL